VPARADRFNCLLTQVPETVELLWVDLGEKFTLFGGVGVGVGLNLLQLMLYN